MRGKRYKRCITSLFKFVPLWCQRDFNFWKRSLSPTVRNHISQASAEISRELPFYIFNWIKNKKRNATWLSRLHPCDPCEHVEKSVKWTLRIEMSSCHICHHIHNEQQRDSGSKKKHNMCFEVSTFAAVSSFPAFIDSSRLCFSVIVLSSWSLACRSITCSFFTFKKRQISICFKIYKHTKTL